jgi:hypothetical protein
LVLVVVGGAGCFESYPASSTCMLDERRSCTCDGGGPGWETCYGDVPAVWGPCVCNGAPVADAGSDRAVSYRTTVSLDGTHSSDPDGQDLMFHWAVDSVPAGSMAMLDDGAAATPTFLADVPGDYAFSLTVDDTIVTSPPAHVTISAHDDAPVAVAAVSANVETGDQVTLDAAATTDPNGDSLTYLWTVTGPPGSTAAPMDPTAATTSFVPDVDGAYQVSLSVDDGRMTTSLTKPVQSYHRVTALPFHPARAAYDKALDRIIFISRDPTNALYAYAPATGTLSTVPLGQVPVAFSVAPSGLGALVADSSGITTVNLQTMQVASRRTVSFTPEDIVHPGDGWAYVFVASTTSSYEIRGVNLSTGAVTVGTRAIYGDMRAHLMPGTSSIYATDMALTEVFSFSSGNTTLTNSRSSIGSDLWTSDDGTHVFAFGMPVYAADLTQVGQLRSYATGVSESSATSTLLVIPAGTMGTEDEAIDVYRYPSLAYDHSVALPPELKNGTPYPAHGRWVFLHADGIHYSVVLQVSSSEWAITNL